MKVGAVIYPRPVMYIITPTEPLDCADVSDLSRVRVVNNKRTVIRFPYPATATYRVAERTKTEPFLSPYKNRKWFRRCRTELSPVSNCPIRPRGTVFNVKFFVVKVSSWKEVRYQSLWYSIIFRTK